MSHRSIVPTYRKHKQSSQAIVTFRLASGKRKDYLLGRFGSQESRAEYARLLAEFQTSHGAMPGPSGPVGHLTINELLVRYLRHCDEQYRNADGTPTGQAADVGLHPVEVADSSCQVLACFLRRAELELGHGQHQSRTGAVR